MRVGGRHLGWLVAAGAVASSAAACSSVAGAPEAGVAASAPSPGTPPAGQCLDAGNLARSILAGARGGSELTVVDAKAVRSPEHEDTYLVAVRFGGDPNEETGVWASATLELGDDSVRSVDVGAVEVTEWPWSLVTEPRIAVDDPAVDAARACL